MQHIKGLNHPIEIDRALISVANPKNQTKPKLKPKKHPPMKQHTKSFATVLAVAGGLVIAGSAQAQYVTNVLSNFQNFHLSATYANWDQSGSQSINGGSGYTPTLTSGTTPGSFEVNAEGYGSGAYTFATPVDDAGATEVQLTFTINSPLTPSTDYMGPNFDLTDGTHQVAFSEYNNYPNSGTAYTVTAALGTLNPADILAFNLEMDPAGYGYTTPYDITYDSLVLLTPVATPEPGTMALAAFGAAGLLIARRRAKIS